MGSASCSHRLVFERPPSWRGAALRHLLLVENRAHAATRRPSATPRCHITVIFWTESVVLESRLAPADMNTRLLGMSSSGFAGIAEQMAVILDDATIFDDRELLASSGVFSLAAPGARGKPDGFGSLCDGLSNVNGPRVRPTEDHDQINRSSYIFESRVRWQTSDLSSVGPHRNDVVSSMVEITDDLTAVPSRSRTGANDRDCPRPSQQSLH